MQDVITIPLWTPFEKQHFKCWNWNLKQVYGISHGTGLFTVRLKWFVTDCTGVRAPAAPGVDLELPDQRRP